MSKFSESIRPAQGAIDYAAFAALIGEYVAWGRERYRDQPRFVEGVFGHQGLALELEHLATRYGAPDGCALLAHGDDAVRGCGAYRRLAPGICEMKRLFIPERFQGQGLGRRLGRALLAAAREEGYAIMRLDTADRMHEAQALYRSLGFRECAPFHAYPSEIGPHIVFMETTLSSL